MKRALKLLSIVVVALAATVAGAALYIDRAGIPSYPVERIELTVELTPERVARGRRIAANLCAACHLDPLTRRLTGKRMPDSPAEFGVAYSLNITQDPEKGIGSWSDGELAYLLRTGIARDGRYTPPWMVKLPNASDEDIQAIIAFLRSDDPLVAADATDDRPSEPSFLTKLLTRVAFKPFAYPQRPIAAPDASDRLAYGRYLANDLLLCFACHSADFKTNDDLRPERSAGFYGGGNPLLDANGRTVHSPNITFDEETGIGGWTPEQFLRAVKQGFRPDATPIVYPMEAYMGLENDEVLAIYAYLETVPKIRKARPSPAPVAVAEGAPAGKQIYYKYSCNSCHGDAGVGLYDLRPGVSDYATDQELVVFIRNPAASVPGIKMPTWDGVIEEDEYAPLAAYVRSLGNSGGGG